MEQARWNHTWNALGAVAPAELLRELVARYSEPHRSYHTLQHLNECFTMLDPAAYLAERLAEVQLALWFHDAIYDTHAQDNEEQSARWAQASLLAGGATSQAAARVQELVLATKHDAIPREADAQLLVDVDLSILGTEADRFAEYERQIREEYSWVPEPGFRQGRRRVLVSFLERPSIYSTSYFVARLEERARTNLARSIQELDVQR